MTLDATTRKDLMERGVPPSAAAVSLFSNCGAGDVGYRAAGFSFEAVAEIDRRRLVIAAQNHPRAAAVWGDVRETWPEVVAQVRAKRRGRPDLLSACPPCQGMSTARRDRGPDSDPEAGGRDERNLLVLPIAEIARELAPRVIVVENVPAFLTRKVPHPDTGAGVSAASLLVSLLLEDYEPFPFLGDLADYGVPQHRKRAFLTFVHRGEEALDMLRRNARAPYPVPTHAPEQGKAPVSLRAALEELGAARLDASSSDRARDPEGHPFHSVPVWNDRIYGMVAAIPKNSGRSAWENSHCANCGWEETSEEAPTCSRCGEVLPRPVILDDGNTVRLVKGFRTSSYRRMAPDIPATTVTTASGRVGSSSTIHPWENRVLSALEAAHLQTFPDGFEWGEGAVEEVGLNAIRAMIGEAVPPLFTRRHGEAILECLGAADPSGLLPRDDQRCVAADDKLRL